MRAVPIALALLASVSLIALSAPDAAAKGSKEKSNHSFSGGIEVGVSTDRNAGSGGGGCRGPGQHAASRPAAPPPALRYEPAPACVQTRRCPTAQAMAERHQG